MLTLNDILLLITFFLSGIGFHVLLRAGFAYRSQINIYPSRWSFIAANWDTTLIRTFLNSILFWWWVTYPGTVSTVLIFFRVPANIANWMTVPVTLGTAAVFGFFIDVLLDSAQSIIAGTPQLAWLNKYLKGQIPSYDPAVVDVAKLDPERKVGE